MYHDPLGSLLLSLNKILQPLLLYLLILFSFWAEEKLCASSQPNIQARSRNLTQRIFGEAGLEITTCIHSAGVRG